MKEEEYNIHQTKTHLSKILRRAMHGIDVFICRGNKRIARIEILEVEEKVRRIGGAKGLITHIDEDFDAPLDDFVDYVE